MSSSTTDHHKYTRLSGRANFRPWMMRTTAALYGDKLYGYVNGYIIPIVKPTPPTTAAEIKAFDAWNALDQAAKAIIVNSVEDHILNCVLDIDAPAQVIWDTIIENHKDNASDTSAFYLAKELNNLKYIDGGDISMETHINTFNGILTRLRSSGENITDLKAAQTLLATLPEETAIWEVIITHCAQLGASLTLASVVSRLLDQDRRMQQKVIPKYAHNAIFSQNPRFTRQPRFDDPSRNSQTFDKSAIFCRYPQCGKLGHLERECDLRKTHWEDAKRIGTPAAKHAMSSANHNPSAHIANGPDYYDSVFETPTQDMGFYC